MAQPIILPSFGAGELSPSLYARVDLSKWHSGAALLENFFVDYRGGVSNRTGTKFLGDSLDASLPSRLIPFIFSTTQAYVLVFDHKKMRVISGGAFVLDDNGNQFVIDTPYEGVDLAILKFAQSADVMTLVHPLYAPRQLARHDQDDWQINLISFVPTSSSPSNVTATPSIATGTTNYRYVVTAVAANGVTESLPSDPVTSTNSETMSTTSGAHQTVAWDPVPGAQLYNVYRQPEVDGGTPSTGQFFGFIGTASDTSFVDANIAPDFSRTPPQDFNPFTGTFGGALQSVSVSAGSNYLTRPTVSFVGGGGTGATASAFLGAVLCAVQIPGAGGYRVGDILTAVGGTFTRPLKAKVTSLRDYGFGNPSSPGNLQIIDPGEYSVLPGPTYVSTIYAATSPIPTTGGSGTGCALFLVWGVMSIPVGNPGNSYASAPQVVLTGGIPAPFNTGVYDAQATATVDAVVGNWPACTAYFQQRQVFAAPLQNPETFYMSKTGDYLNFGYSTPSRPDDSIIGTLAAQQVNTVRHLVALQSMIALTAAGAWRVDSGQTGGAVTPSTIEANPQVFNGCSDVPPIIVGRELLYVQVKGSIVRNLQFNYIENVYAGNDLTTLANHLFFGHQIIEWAYAEEPYKIIWCVRDDGMLLAFTYLREQEVYAWTHHVTRGKFKNICVIPEGTEDAVYVIVERYIQGAKHHYVERFASRNMGAIPEGVTNISSITRVSAEVDHVAVPADLSRAWFVDCGLQYPLTYPAAALTPAEIYATPSIASASVVAGGSGYVTPVAVITDETGSGAVISLFAIGAVLQATVTVAGSGYTNPTVTVVDEGGSGSGAVLALELTRDVVMTTNADAFASTRTGDMVRVNNGWGTVRQVSNRRQIIVNVQHALTSTWPAEEGEWSCTTPVSSVAGLDHLEGETVSILADGNVMPQQRVTGGVVALQSPASAIFVGLPFASRLQSLYLDIPGEQPTVQGKRKKISAVAVRQQDTRGLRVGMTFDDMIEIKEREFEEMGAAILPFTGDRRVAIPPTWDVAGQICVAQFDPLPATILGLIPEISIGDTPQ